MSNFNIFKILENGLNNSDFKIFDVDVLTYKILSHPKKEYFIDKYKNKLNWNIISSHGDQNFWTFERINKYYDKIDFSDLYEVVKLPDEVLVDRANEIFNTGFYGNEPHIFKYPEDIIINYIIPILKYDAGFKVFINYKFITNEQIDKILNIHFNGKICRNFIDPFLYNNLKFNNFLKYIRYKFPNGIKNKSIIRQIISYKNCPPEFIKEYSDFILDQITKGKISYNLDNILLVLGVPK